MKLLNFWKTLTAKSLFLEFYNVDTKKEYKLKICPVYNKKGYFETISRKDEEEIYTNTLNFLDWKNNAVCILRHKKIVLSENLFLLRILK